MGRRGPAPMPTKLRVLHGETRPSRVNAAEPQPREAPPEPPDWLDADARRVWERTVRELSAMGLAHAADADALVAYCTSVVDMARAQQALDRDGVLLVGVEGVVIRHPANVIFTQCAALVGRFAREFGLTPAARVGLSSDAREPEDSRALAARLLSN